MTMIELDGASLTIEQLLEIADRGEHVALSPAARDRVRAARAVVERRARGDEPAYGINTGFGSFAEVKIAPDALETLQLNLLRSHAAGLGDPLPVRAVRATMALRANVLAKGFSGISLETLEALLALLNHGVHPSVPSRGSVGASGDLAPLAHLALVLIGEGEASVGTSRRSGRAALARVGLTPLHLEAKEGLSLLNGTQAMLALGLLALRRCELLVDAADIAGALSLEALKGTPVAFDPRIHRLRPYRGQAAVASNLRALVAGSEIRASHVHCPRVQDAYSLRCMPQVHGAVRDALDYVRSTLCIEMNSVTDNPLVFPEREEVLSGGNFHGQPL